MVLLRRKRSIPLRASDIMSQPVETTNLDDTLRDAARKMVDKRIGSLLVVDSEGKLRGIITERDILYACAEGWDCGSKRVWEVMTENPATVTPDDSIVDVIRKMRDLNVRHIPVIDVDGKPVGMISARDVLDAVLCIFQ
jgi:CBS domain-containing protein